MNEIYFIDRKSGKTCKEDVYGHTAVTFLYSTSFLSKTLGWLILHLFAKRRFISALYGLMQKCSFSKRKIAPFIKRFEIDTSEFVKPVYSFTSFNDFFIRSLKPESRLIHAKPAIIPADGRYRFFQEIRKTTPFSVKSRPFCLETVLQSRELSDEYDGGSCVMARLCPIDCHRFYFPVDATPGPSRCINGALYSVNPIAITDNPWIWGVNRRICTILETPTFGKVVYMEVGATNVGSIIQTYQPGTQYKKGEEKGYFSFGGSALLLFFKRGKIVFDTDLNHALEVRCLIGDTMGDTP